MVVASSGRSAKSSMMSRSRRVSRRNSASRVSSSRAARSRVNSFSARVICTVSRRRIAMCPRACCQVGLADPDGAQDQDVVPGLDEPQGGQVGEQLPVVDQVRRVRSRCRAASAGQSGVRGPHRRRAGVAAGDLVGQQQFQEVGVAQLPGPGERESFREGVFHPGQLQGLFAVEGVVGVGASMAGIGVEVFRGWKFSHCPSGRPRHG